MIKYILLDIDEIDNVGEQGYKKQFFKVLESENIKIITVDDMCKYQNVYEQMIVITQNDLWIKGEREIINVDNEDKISAQGANVEQKLTDKVAVIGYGREYKGRAPYVLESFEGVDMQYLNMVYARKQGLPLIIGETSRLIIREMTLDDLDEMYELYDSLKDCKYIESLYERSKEEEFSKNYIENMYRFYNYGLWLIFRKEDGRLIGRAGIEHREIDNKTCCELGYLIGKPWQHNHYAEEACEYILEYAWEYLGIEKMYTCIHSDNIPSIKFAEKLGFRKIANAVFPESQLENVILLKTMYKY